MKNKNKLKMISQKLIIMISEATVKQQLKN